jgi:hypothetical protein
VLLTPLAAALDGISTVDVQPAGGALDVRIHARGPSTSDAQLTQLRDRIERRYGDAASLVVSRAADGSVDARLHLPLEQTAFSDDDDAVLEAALVTA